MFTDARTDPSRYGKLNAKRTQRCNMSWYDRDTFVLGYALLAIVCFGAVFLVYHLIKGEEEDEKIFDTTFDSAVYNAAKAKYGKETGDRKDR